MLSCSLFSETDKGKMNQLLQETTNLRQMTNQVAYETFATRTDKRSFPAGQKVIFMLLYCSRI